MAGNPHPESMFYELDKGEQTDYGTYTSKRTGVIQSQSEYNKTLVQYTTSPPDSLDFDAGTVLLVDLGKRGSGGYSVEVSSVDVADNHVTANITLRAPGKCMAAAIVTNPYQFVSIPTKRKSW